SFWAESLKPVQETNRAFDAPLRAKKACNSCRPDQHGFVLRFTNNRLAEVTEPEPSSVSRRADCSALALNTVGYVSRDSDRAKQFVFGAAFDDREGHLDVYFAS